MPTASEIARDVIGDWDCMRTKGAPDPERVVLARAHLLLRDEITSIAEDSPIGQIRNALWLALSKVEESDAAKAE